MKCFTNIKTIIFDFDGVILDSMNVRDFGFRKIFEKYPEKQVEKLIEYHRVNGGLSRFHKIKYFYEKILSYEISNDKILDYSNEFSIIMRNELAKEKYIIKEWVQFIQNNCERYNMHIASGSEETELRYICKKLGIDKYFKSINGSPTPKKELVKNIINENKYDKNKVVIIGDSINDYDAAVANNTRFIGYNNKNLKEICKYYIESL